MKFKDIYNRKVSCLVRLFQPKLDQKLYVNIHKGTKFYLFFIQGEFLNTAGVRHSLFNFHTPEFLSIIPYIKKVFASVFAIS